MEKVIHYAELLLEDRYIPKKSRGEIMGEITRKHVKKLNKEKRKINDDRSVQDS